MRVAPDEGPKLGNRYEARQVVHLRLGVSPRLFKTAQIKKLCPVVDFCPEALEIQASIVRGGRSAMDEETPEMLARERTAKNMIRVQGHDSWHDGRLPAMNTAHGRGGDRFHTLFGLFEGLAISERVKVGEDAKDFGEAVGL